MAPATPVIMKHLLRAFHPFFLAVYLLLCHPAQALEPTQGPVILTLTDLLDTPNDGPRANFDVRMLEALPQHSFITSTPWYKTPTRFTGPLLADVLRAAGARGAHLNAVALNGYKVRIPASDASLGVVLARQVDDKPLSVRDRGPLFIVYPFDSSPDLKTTTHFGRSIWQLRAIEVE